MSYLGEIKRRKVFQVAAIYAVTAWLIVQIIDVIDEPLSLPESSSSPVQSPGDLINLLLLRRN